MWLLIAFLAMFTLLLAWFNVWIIRTIYYAKGGDYYSKQWHFVQGLIVLLHFLYSCKVDCRVALVWVIAHWIAFDGIINLYAFPGRGFFYVGDSAAGDRMLRRMSKRPEVLAAVLKGGLLAAVIAGVVYSL